MDQDSIKKNNDKKQEFLFITDTCKLVLPFSFKLKRDHNESILNVKSSLF